MTEDYGKQLDEIEERLDRIEKMIKALDDRFRERLPPEHTKALRDLIRERRFR